MGLLELTDIEIYKLGLKVLVEKLDAYGFLRFIVHHFKQLNATQTVDLSQQSLPGKDNSIRPNQQIRETELQD